MTMVSVGIWVVLLMVVIPQESWGRQSQSQSESSCVPSSCGKIANISHPFRRKDDPPNCGDRRYELECVNDVAVLRLSGEGEAEYQVQAINYNNHTIRLVDPNIQDHNCSSIPRHFLYRYNFSDPGEFMFLGVLHPHPYVDLYRPNQVHNDPSSPFPIESDLFLHIIYMSCNSPVGEYYSTHVYNYTSCLDDLHTYVVAAPDLSTREWKPGCHVKLIAPTSGLFQLEQVYGSSGSGSDVWISGDGNLSRIPNVPYSDIHRALAYGFELSWLPPICEQHCGSPTSCYFDDSIQEAVCYYDDTGPPCHPRLLCRVREGLSHFVEYSLHQFFLGMYNLTRLQQPLNDEDYTAEGGWITLLSFMAGRVLCGVTMLVVLLIYRWRRRHLSTYVNIESFLQDNNLMPIRYSYKEIKKMTKSFKVKLGQGGFGSVYKGKLRSGPQVAIKMLKQSKANGEEFINEVATIGRIHHVNVVRLIGFCVEGSKRALVYDFMSNGSLDKYIFSKEGSISLSYEKIYEISLGVASGISYLHQGCDIQILHFDIKPHNILLDENFIPKVSDFGLAKLYPIDHSIVTLTDKRGTIGYIAPELFYNNLGGISYKADVYSFGMLLMEVAGRRKNLNPQAENSSQIFFPTWIYDQFSKGKEDELDNCKEDEKSIAKKLIIIALWCIQLKPSDRPSMKRVVEMLEGELEDLTMPPKPLLYPNETPIADESLNSEQFTSDHSTNVVSDFGEIIPSDTTVENI